MAQLLLILDVTVVTIALGAAVVSSIAAASLAGISPAGFSRRFATAAALATGTALVTLAIAPAPRPATAADAGLKREGSWTPAATHSTTRIPPGAAEITPSGDAGARWAS